MNTIDFSPGMQVHSRDGAHLGDVAEVWAQTEGHGALPRSRALFEDYGPIKGTSHLFGTDDGYLEVRQDSFLGFGGRILYVPVAEVEQVHSNESINLRAGGVHYESRFTALPDVQSRRAA